MARFRNNRGKLSKGAQTRQEILAKAVQLASVEGLEALSIGVLAKQTGMSKSGLFQHFGSKQKLQLAILEAQGEHFAAEVLGIRESEQKGLFRLWQLVESWLRNARRGEYFSGSFFLAASFEYDSRSGPIANNVVAVLKKWLSAIAQALKEAQKAGELDSDLDRKQLLFEILSGLLTACWAKQILKEDAALHYAENAILARLQADAGDEIPKDAFANTDAFKKYQIKTKNEAGT